MKKSRLIQLAGLAIVLIAAGCAYGNRPITAARVLQAKGFDYKAHYPLVAAHLGTAGNIQGSGHVWLGFGGGQIKGAVNSTLVMIVGLPTGAETFEVPITSIRFCNPHSPNDWVRLRFSQKTLYKINKGDPLFIQTNDSNSRDGLVGSLEKSSRDAILRTYLAGADVAMQRVDFERIIGPILGNFSNC